MRLGLGLTLALEGVNDDDDEPDEEEEEEEDVGET